MPTQLYNHAHQPPTSDENAQRPPSALRTQTPSPHNVFLRRPIPLPARPFSTLRDPLPAPDAKNPILRPQNTPLPQSILALPQNNSILRM